MSKGKKWQFRIIPVHLSVQFVCLFDFGCFFKAVISLLVQIAKNQREREVYFSLYTLLQGSIWCFDCLFNQGKLSTIKKKMDFTGQAQTLSLQKAFPQLSLAQPTHPDNTYGAFCSLYKPLALLFNIIGNFICLYTHLSQLLKDKEYFFSMLYSRA